MKNSSIDKIKSKVRIAIKGKNVNRFLLRIHRNKISILNVNRASKDEAYILIYFKDYEKVLELNTIYEIFIVSYGGWEKNKREYNKNSLLILGIILGVLFVFFLSKLIFKVEVITNDTKMREKLLYELSRYDIKQFKFQKSYNKIQKIKEEILKKYQNDIEWIEIELVGTKYIIRYEPRILNEKTEKSNYRHIVASKNAIVYSVVSSRGQILKYKNDYVKEGDIIVSGEIKLNDETKKIVSAEGEVYGEVWYEVEVFYPFGYYEQKKTGNTKNVYAVKFLSWKIELFNFNKFYDKIIKEEVIIKNKVLPLSFVKEKQIEVETKSSINTIDEAYDNAISLAKQKINNKLKDNEHIIKYKLLNKNIENNGVRIKMFFSICENITEYREIKEEKDE